MQDTNLQAFVTLGLGFLAAYLVARALRERTLIEVGALFALLGVGLGPMGMDIIAPTTVSSTHPLVAALVGWVALEVGLGASFRTDGGLTPGSMRAGLLYSVVGLLGFATLGVAWLLISVGLRRAHALD